MLDEGTQAGGDDPPVATPVEAPLVVPVPALEAPDVTPPAQVAVGAQTLTWLPLEDVSMLHVVPEGQLPGPSPPVQDETQKLSP